MLFCVAVMAREALTDERLDDFKENVNQRFDQVDKRLAQIDARFDAMNARFDSMQRMMLVGFITLFAGITGSIVTAILAG